MDNELFDEIVKALDNDEIKNIKYKEDFHHSKAFGYYAWGTFRYKGIKYEFMWNHNEGIMESTIEEAD